MEWSLVVLGTALLTFVTGLNLGIHFPTDVIGEPLSTVLVFLFSVSFVATGLVLMYWGMRK